MEPGPFDQSPTWQPEEIPLGDGRVLVLEDSCPSPKCSLTAHMKIVIHITRLLAILATLTSPLQASVDWAFADSGITVVSSGGDGSDSSVPSQQDIIAPSVTISRNMTEGIFNVIAEDIYIDIVFTGWAGHHQALGHTTAPPPPRSRPPQSFSLSPQPVSSDGNAD
jgi:hypothetical protein